MQTITLHLEIPPGFAAACKLAGIKPQAILQLFTNELSVYRHFTAPYHDTDRGAASVFNTFLRSHTTEQRPDAVARLINIDYTRQMMELIAAGIKPARKEKRAQTITEAWYQALQPLNLSI